MAAKGGRLASARRYLEVFEDSWKSDHAQAMQCREFEESLAEAAKVFQLMHELIQMRRTAVYRGLIEPLPELDREEKQLYTDWLGLVDVDMASVETLEETFGPLEGAAEFRACRDAARAFLARWMPAVPAKAVGSRVIDFSEEDADQLRAALNGPPGTPGQSTHPARSLLTGDSSLLK
jgi:hypothetical protein